MPRRTQTSTCVSLRTATGRPFSIATAMNGSAIYMSTVGSGVALLIASWFISLPARSISTICTKHTVANSARSNLVSWQEKTLARRQGCFNLALCVAKMRLRSMVVWSITSPDTCDPWPSSPFRATEKSYQTMHVVKVERTVFFSSRPQSRSTVKNFLEDEETLDLRDEASGQGEIPSFSDLRGFIRTPVYVQSKAFRSDTHTSSTASTRQPSRESTRLQSHE